jgi:hypothetical protein
MARDGLEAREAAKPAAPKLVTQRLAREG